MAYKLEHQYGLTKDGLVELICYEKNPDLGGTWYENRYPGAACDNPAHCYNFTFSPNPNWSHYYVGAKEIHGYIKDTVDNYALQKFFQLNSKVVDAKWVEDEAKWHVKIDQHGTIIDDVCDIFVNACGILNQWTWPSIEGLFDFKGHLVHSARWDDSYDMTGKTVCVIGNGSTGLQIVPQLQKVVKKLVCIIRSPTWISPTYVGHKSKVDNGRNFEYTEEDKERFRTDRTYFRDYRRQIDSEMNKFFYALLKDSPQQQGLYDASIALHKERLAKKPELFEKLTPTWQPGCRRLSPGEGYLEALAEDNVEVVLQEIERVVPEGLITVDGVEHKLDALVTATGFDTSFPPRFPLIGRHGRDLRKEWAENPRGYFGLAASGFPNYFIFMGPACPIGHGSLIPMMECTADYVVKVTKKILAEQIKAVDVKQEAVDEFFAYSQSFMGKTVWTSGCRSWYKGGTVDGPVTAMYPGSAMHYRFTTAEPRWEDYDIKYWSKNRYQYFGNGFTEIEESGANLSFYLD
ncbi:uncharacterized protein Z519_02161 [Cladophialophora bantiana CBS 173.52]|uniref:Uncharacterized protein n=1 Tax=Cladophialophora bantiana (strain ATCC 10958 / CBS 173.52 / CDC B-1940 / NIH 8579) TaxID=1442370 RepID=A0A0D2I0R1_CLAB1|nr:uncharacterized protein Z519_02161 [Cladophialophora bantiana CBS 173.52]KIW96770.1 hypothetical protein Z519_02161 [Cladophialophora bantiana CBS 173.52]